MTKQQWQETVKKYNEECDRLHKFAKNQALALTLIAKAQELTGTKMSLNDAISHLAKIEACK